MSTPPQPSPSRLAQIVLFVVGVGLTVIAVAGVFGAWDRTTTSHGSSDSTVVVDSPAKTTTTHGTTSVSSHLRPTDAVTTALLGSGLVFLLVGLLLPRITSITLPGGGGIVLSPAAHAKIAATLSRKLEGDPRLTDPDAYQLLYMQAVKRYKELAQTQGYGTVVRPRPGRVAQEQLLLTGDEPDDLAETAVNRALDDVSRVAPPQQS